MHCHSGFIPKTRHIICVQSTMAISRRKSDSLIALVLAAASLTAAAEREVESHDTIRAAAREHVLAQADRYPVAPSVRVGKLDRRLRLGACELPLQTYDSPNGLNGGRGVVGVRCDGARPWKIYVPVEVALMQAVVVSRRPLTRGQTLTSDDLMLSEVDISRLHKAYFTRIADATGLRVKRALAASTTLHAGMLEREELIKRGSQVEIVALHAGLQVRMRGKALADGAKGDRVKVKNLNSGRIVSGTVTGRGIISVME